MMTGPVSISDHRCLQELGSVKPTRAVAPRSRASTNTECNLSVL